MDFIKKIISDIEKESMIQKTELDSEKINARLNKVNSFYSRQRWKLCKSVRCSTRDYFQNIMSGYHGIYISEPAVSVATGKSQILVVHSVKKNNQIVEMVAGSLALED